MRSDRIAQLSTEQARRSRQLVIRRVVQMVGEDMARNLALRDWVWGGSWLAELPTADEWADAVAYAATH